MIWSYDPCSYGRNFSSYVERPEKFSTSAEFEPVISRGHGHGLGFQTPLKSWIFQVSVRNSWNCLHNCQDLSFTRFHIRSSMYDSFHIISSMYLFNWNFHSPPGPFYLHCFNMSQPKARSCYSRLCHISTEMECCRTHLQAAILSQ